MNPHPSTVVSLHPYFKVHPGKLEDFKAKLPEFVSRTSTEDACLYYEFTLNDDVVFCREAYVGAAGALGHLANVDDLLKEALSISDLVRLEVHGGAAELDQMREPLAELPVDWFVYEEGLVKGGD